MLVILGLSVNIQRVYSQQLNQSITGTTNVFAHALNLVCFSNIPPTRLDKELARTFETKDLTYLSRWHREFLQCVWSEKLDATDSVNTYAKTFLTRPAKDQPPPLNLVASAALRVAHLRPQTVSWASSSAQEVVDSALGKDLQGVRNLYPDAMVWAPTDSGWEWLPLRSASKTVFVQQYRHTLTYAILTSLSEAVPLRRSGAVAFVSFAGLLIGIIRVIQAPLLYRCASTANLGIAHSKLLAASSCCVEIITSIWIFWNAVVWQFVLDANYSSFMWLSNLCKKDVILALPTVVAVYTYIGIVAAPKSHSLVGSGLSLWGYLSQLVRSGFSNLSSHCSNIVDAIQLSIGFALPLLLFSAPSWFNILLFFLSGSGVALWLWYHLLRARVWKHSN